MRFLPADPPTPARMTAEALSPYRGLEAFREQDTRWLFGLANSGRRFGVSHDEARFSALVPGPAGWLAPDPAPAPSAFASRG